MDEGEAAADLTLSPGDAMTVEAVKESGDVEMGGPEFIGPLPTSEAKESMSMMPPGAELAAVQEPGNVDMVDMAKPSVPEVKAKSVVLEVGAKSVVLEEVGGNVLGGLVMHKQPSTPVVAAEVLPGVKPLISTRKDAAESIDTTPPGANLAMVQGLGSVDMVDTLGPLAPPTDLAVVQEPGNVDVADAPKLSAPEVEEQLLIVPDDGGNALGDLDMGKQSLMLVDAAEVLLGVKPPVSSDQEEAMPRAHPSAECQRSSEHNSSPPSDEPSECDPNTRDVTGRDSDLLKMEVDEVKELGETKRKPRVSNEGEV